MPNLSPDIVDDLHDRLVALVREHGPLDVATLSRRARQVTEVVEDVLDIATLLVRRPDGRVAYLGDVLDGIVLTHRVRGSLRDRTDLWLGTGVQPFLAMATLAPLPLTGGGEARIAETIDPVLLGPPGWLPPAEPGDLIGLCWSGGRLDVRLVSPEELAGSEAEDDVRRLVGERYCTQPWWGTEDEGLRHGLLIRALSGARLEDPALLRTPHAPLDELLPDPHARRHAPLRLVRSTEPWPDDGGPPAAG